MQVITSPRITKGEAAEKLGLKVYDCALPQPWVEQATRVTETPMDLICSSFVWCYDGSCMGYPYPLTVNAFNVLKTYDTKVGTNLTNDKFTVLEINN